MSALVRATTGRCYIFRRSLVAYREHVSHVTIIPLDSPIKEEDGKLKELRETLLKNHDTSKVDEVLKPLSTAGDERPMSRSGFLLTLKSLQWLQTQANIPVTDLNEFWVLLEDVRREQTELFLPCHLAEILSLLAKCQRPSTELVRLVSQRCRRLHKSFSAEEIGGILRAYSTLGFASVGTISMLGSRLASLLHDPSDTVKGWHLVALAGAYPTLHMSWKKSKHRDQELKMWKAVTVALPQKLPEMSARHLAVLLNAFARMDFSSSGIHSNVSQMFSATANHLVPRIALNANAEFVPRELALISNAFAKTRAVACTGVGPLFKAVASTAMSQIQHCNQQDLSNLFNAFAQLSIRDPPLFDAGALVVISKIADFDPQHLCTTAHAFGKQQVVHQDMFKKIADASLRLLDRFTPLQLGNLAYGFGRLQVRHKQLVGSLSDEVIYRGTIGKTLQNASEVYRFELRTLQNLTQAFSRLMVADHRLYFVLFDMTRQRVREFARRVKDTEAEQDVNASVHTVVDKSRVSAAANRGEDIEILTGRGLSMMLSAFAKSQADFHSLLRWVPHQVTSLQGQYSTTQLANIFNSCSKLGIKHAAMYSELLSNAKPRIPQMSPKSLTMLLRSMSRAKLSSRTVTRHALKVISAKVGDLNTIDLCTALVGCSELNYRDERFLRLLASVVRTRMNEMTGSQLACACAAYAHMRIQHPAWFDAILFELFQRQSELSEKDATNVAYAMLLLAAVERHESKANEASSYPFDTHRGVLYSLLATTNEHRRDLSYPAIYQLQIVELYLRLLAPSVYEEMQQELKIMLAKARKVSVIVDDYMQSSSRLHRRISQWFTRVGLEHRSEVFVGPFMLDMLIGERVVVEVDGPTHFYRDTNTRTASSLLKASMLRAMGFHVKHLPYQEWQQCGNATRRTMYCSAFWKDVVAAHEQDFEGLHPRLPELVDILDVVVSWQTGEGPHPSTALLRERQPAQRLPAFYSEENELEEVVDRSLTGRTPQELLAAHEEAEAAMAADRDRQITAQQRMFLDQREERDQELQEELSKLFPRSKRREVRHSTTGIFDFESLEADTDSSDDEFETQKCGELAVGFLRTNDEFV
ncbi:unnamed protein product [Durusdinium trenchii]|uniref:RAP domain-containing protein n=1 Tax=Durusdinium trenchii TaxID=1381693 RepID=A0ABP0NGL2_9DINO